MPKPLRVVGGQTLVSRVAGTLGKAGVAVGYRVIVVSPGFDRAASGLEGTGCSWALQPEARGTGDAARWGLEAVPALGDPLVIVALADVPFTRPETYSSLLKESPAGGIAFVTGILPEPGSLGRVLRGPDGGVQDIIEFKELAPGQETIKEINVGHFCGRRSLLLDLISRIKPGAKGGELYLTSIVAEARVRGLSVAGIRSAKVSEGLGANTPEELEALAQMADKEGE